MRQRVPTCPSLAPCSPPSRPLRAAYGGGLRPVLTAAARGATLIAGRDEETAPSVEQRNCTRYQILLQNFLDTTLSASCHRGHRSAIPQADKCLCAIAAAEAWDWPKKRGRTTVESGKTSCLIDTVMPSRPRHNGVGKSH
jgi:hypothetical protein